MPFIRYRTGDYAKLSEQSCKCKRNHIIFEDLTGRWNQEMVLGKSGSLISIAALNLHSDVFKNIKNYQFYQKKAGEIALNIVIKPGFSEKDKENILNAFYKKVGNDLDFEFKIVENISLTKRGKLKLLIQDLKLDF